MQTIEPLCMGQHGHHGIKCDGCPFAMDCMDKAKLKVFKAVNPRNQ